LPYRQRKKEGREGETDEKYDCEWAKGLGLERSVLVASFPFDFDNPDGEGLEIVGVTASL
jgi:hypothetical protein